MQKNISLCKGMLRAKDIHANALPFVLLCLFSIASKQKESTLPSKGSVVRLTVTHVIGNWTR